MFKKPYIPASGPRDILPAEMDTANQFRAMHFFTMLIIALAMIPWIFGDKQILGFNVTGWSWIIGAASAFLICIRNMGLISFPLRLWLPWIGILLSYWFFGKDNPDATQSLAQMLSPLAVGCAASIFRPDSSQMEIIVRRITRVTWIVLILVSVRISFILAALINSYGFYGLATPEMIGLLLLGSFYASFYACGSDRHLYYYLTMLAITFISLTRGPIIAMTSCLPLTLSPLAIRKRILFCAALIVCALVIFNTEQLQARMFYSGSGKLEDMRWSNPDLRTSGRSLFYDLLWPDVEENPVLGNGFNSYRSIFTAVGLEKVLPHNDWLKLLHDMGIVGAGLYLITIVLQMWFLVRIAHRSIGARAMLAYGAATAFVPYALIMLTDNVILYVQYFGNLHFALLGIVYGALRRDEELENV